MSKEKKSLLFAVLAAGSLWGLSEVLLGAFLRNHAPHILKAGILTGVGIGIIGIFIAMFGKPLYALGIGLVAIMAKQLVVPVLGVSVMCKANACLAVMLSAGAIAAAVSFFSRKKPVLAGAAAGFSSSAIFYFGGMSLAPCPYLLSFNNRMLPWLLTEGLLWAAFPAVLFPLGILVGEKLKAGTFGVLDTRPAFYYRLTSAITVCSLVISAVVIYMGA